MSPFLDPAAITAEVVGGLWTSVTVVDETDSTNADLAAAARASAPGGSVLLTGHQRSGRGRFARSWRAPPDTSVAMSALVYPATPLRSWGWLSLIAGVAVVDGLREAAGLDAWLKWPNDVEVEGRKICGVLSEAVATDRGTAAVLGMGINVTLAADELPVPTATSVRLAGSAADASAVAIATLRALERHYRRWDAGESMRAAYRDRCATLGADVAVHVGEGGPVSGRAVDVDEAGCLVVETPAGRRAFAAGDVVHLRRPAR